jgi:hypothetical protein
MLAAMLAIFWRAAPNPKKPILPSIVQQLRFVWVVTRRLPAMPRSLGKLRKPMQRSLGQAITTLK